MGLVSTTAATAAAKSAHGCSGRWELASICDCFWGSVAGGLNARPEARNRNYRRQKLKPRRTSLAVLHSPPGYSSLPGPPSICLIRHSSAAPGYSCPCGLWIPLHPREMTRFLFRGEPLRLKPRSKQFVDRSAGSAAPPNFYLAAPP